MLFFVFGFSDVGKILHHEMEAVLLSYPKSGNTWVRYIIECITNRPTLMHYSSWTPVVTDGPILKFLNKEHVYHSFPVFKVHERGGISKIFGEENSYLLILLLRDYHECIPRNIKGVLKKTPISQKMQEFRIKFEMKSYLRNVEFFVNYNPYRKMVVYYEDMMTQPEKEIQKICNFLGGDKDEVSKFFFEYDEHRKSSLALYEKYWDGSKTFGRHMQYHVQSLDKNALESLETLVKESSKEVYKIISRYDKSIK